MVVLASLSSTPCEETDDMYDECNEDEGAGAVVGESNLEWFGERH